MDIRTREAVRYLGYGRHAIDERIFDLIQDSFRELEQISDVRFIYRIFEILPINENELELGKTIIKSKNLCKNLRDCSNAIVFGATLGTAVDRLMKKYAITDMSKAVVLQACAASLLEEHCDMMQENLEKELGSGMHLRPRFSPGYGDFSIIYQKELLQMLDAPKKIGLSMTDGYMLTPTKSVTAIMGISDTTQECNIKGCEMCSKTDCLYRRS